MNLSYQNADGNGVIYAVDANGNLFWLNHTGNQTGANSWTDEYGRVIGTGWDFPVIVAGGLGTIYAGTSASDYHILWYRHIDPLNGSSVWSDSNGVDVGANYRGARIFTCDGDGAFYAVRESDDRLFWGVHVGRLRGTDEWLGVNGQTVQVGNGWDKFVRIFSGGAGILYAIDKHGGLWWFKHLGYLNGSGDWQGGNLIGSSWDQFKFVLNGGNGVIYAIDTDGNLFWYKHLGYANGSADFLGPVQIGSGWGHFKNVFTPVASEYSPYLQRYVACHAMLTDDEFNTAARKCRQEVLRGSLSGAALGSARGGFIHAIFSDNDCKAAFTEAYQRCEEGTVGAVKEIWDKVIREVDHVGRDLEAFERTRADR